MLREKIYHRGSKVDQRGRVSALCFKTPRAINMERALWTLADAFVTCPKCAAIIARRRKDGAK